MTTDEAREIANSLPDDHPAIQAAKDIWASGPPRPDTREVVALELQHMALREALQALVEAA